MPRAKAKPTETGIQIQPIDMRCIEIPILGTAPYCQHKFSAKAKAKIAATHIAGSAGKSKKVREPRNFEAEFHGATHLTEDGYCGIPASAFRTAAIDVCRAVGFMMTRAKISVFVEADDLDVEDATPLVYILGKRERFDASVRNESGVVDLRSRPLWRHWGAFVRFTFDNGMITEEDVVNLVNRAGLQVGIGEGRPFSRQSTGVGFGTFRVCNPEDLNGLEKEKVPPFQLQEGDTRKRDDS